MARNKCPECPPEGSPAWLATFSDLMTLVLCFFVLLFSMSTIDAEKVKGVAEAMSQSSLFSIDTGGKPSPSLNVDKLTGNGIMQLPNAGTGIQDAITKEQKDSQDQLKEMASDFKTYFAEQNISDQVEVNENGDYVEIIIGNTLLFDIGKADLKPAAIDALDIIAIELQKYPDNEIKIEGHTDNMPVSNAQFPSNWELSACRAIAVTKYYVGNKGFSPFRISTEGFGEFRPAFPNDSAENRAKNRRVTIKIMGMYNSKV